MNQIKRVGEEGNAMAQSRPQPRQTPRLRPRSRPRPRKERG